MAGFFTSRLFLISLVIVIVAATLPLYVSGYILGLLTVAYYFGVFAMAWDLLFGFAGEVNFGPTFLIGVGAYTAGILNNQYGWSVYLCIVLGALASVIAGFVLALPALRVRGPYFGLTTLVAVLMLQNFVVVFADLTGGEIGLTIPDVITINAERQLLDRARLHDHQCRDPLRAFAVADRACAAGQRAGPGSGRRARLQHRQAQARRLHRQRVLLRPVRRAAGVLFRHRVGRHRRRRRGRRATSSSPPCSAAGARCSARRSARSS